MDKDEIDYEKLLDDIIKGYDPYRTEQDIFPYIRAIIGEELDFRPFGYGNREDNEIFRKIDNLISVRYKYGKTNASSTTLYSHFESWIEAHKKGGHFLYQKYLKEEENQERLHKEASRKSMWYDAENAEQMFNDYPIVKKERDLYFWLSILGAILTTASLIVAIVK